ncbi:MAG: nucleotidyltransferase family protein [Pseudomonadota bacterium]
MGALVADRPKALIEVSGRPLLDHALDVVRGAAGGPIVVNAHYRADALEHHLAAATDVTVLREAPGILGSGGGVRNALSVLGPGSLATLNADAVWRGPNPLAALCDAWDPGQMAGLLLLVPRDRAVGRLGGGDFALGTDGRVTPDKQAGLVYTGAQILGAGIVGRWPEGAFSMWEIWRALLDEARLFGCLYPGFWADVGHPAGIAAAEAMLARADV